jgi:signal transduction histidine kinase
MAYDLTVENTILVLLGLLALLALVNGIRAAAKLGLRQPVVLYLLLYLALATLWVIVDILARRSRLLFLEADVITLIPFFGALILGIVFLLVSSAFLPVKFQNWPLVILGIILFIIAGLIASKVISVQGVPLRLGTFPVYRLRVVQGLLLLGWLLVNGRIAQMILISYRKANRPLHRNRIAFWALSALVIYVGDMLLFTGFYPGSLLHLVGGYIAGYVLVSHDLADVLQLGLRAFSFLLISLFSASLYAGVFLSLQPQIISTFQLSEMTASLLLGGLLAFVFNPIIILLIRRMDKIVLGLRYDPSASVREYSQGISNIVNLDYLANTALSLIGKTFRSERNYLFMVDEEKVAGQGFYAIRLIKASHEDTVVNPMRMEADSPAAAFFSQARLPLTQYDLDLLPQFRETLPEHRAWFTSLEVDVYVPICTKTQWIGLFVLGPKTTGERYFSEDMLLLITLADQTAVALENARLFANLVKVNQDLVHAQSALEEANQHLREADELKSAFIGVVTHEMRTPLANIAFSLQLISMYGVETMLPEQRDQVEQLNVGVKQARSMVENLITFASFLNKQVVIELEPLDFAEVVKASLISLNEIACVKEIQMKLDIVGELLPVMGDRKHLENAVYQLVYNAIKFNKPKGRVWISCWTASNALYFDVKDTGVGVERNKLASLWGGFTQSADPLRRGLEGLGLGLGLVKYIVAAHGGQVWADSWEGKGSVFGFQIPLEPLVGMVNPADAFQIRQDLPRPQEGFALRNEIG